MVDVDLEDRIFAVEHMAWERSGWKRCPQERSNSTERPVWEEGFRQQEVKGEIIIGQSSQVRFLESLGFQERRAEPKV